MVYNQLFLRIIFSIIFLILFFTFYFFYPKYLVLLVLFIYLLIFYEVFKNFIFYNLLIYLYLIFSLSVICLYLIYLYNESVFLLFIIIVLLFDTFSYLFGKLFGSHKILPFISPNKTLEGLIGGIITTTLFIFLYNYYFNEFLFLSLIFFNFLVIIFSFLGDVLQSFIKRKSNIKDSSNLLPGHGGFFDRMDSYILSVFILPFHSLIL